ncbi:hypothetical protein ACTK7E_004224 [Escherichia coli]
MATMDSKYIQHLRKISAVLLRLISRTLKLFPFGLVIVPVILFYFAPDSFLAEIIHEWKNADISEQVTLVRLYLKVTFTCAFVGKRLARTVLIFTEKSDQLSRATDRVPGLPASPGYAQ